MQVVVLQQIYKVLAVIIIHLPDHEPVVCTCFSVPPSCSIMRNGSCDGVCFTITAWCIKKSCFVAMLVIASLR